VNGAADIGFSSVAYSPGIFTLNEVFSLPFLYPSMKVGSRAMWDHFQNEPALQAEFREVKVLWFVSSPMLRTHTVRKPIRSLEDIKGLKLRTGGGTQTDSIKALGAVPVIMGSSDVYTALERGTVDGLTFPWEAVKAYRIYEVTKYHNSASLWGGKFYAIMNKKKWESLPPDVKKVITDLSGAWGTAFASDAWENADMEGEEYLKKMQGQEIIDFTPQEVKLWQNTVKPVWDEWVSKVEAKNLPGRKILDDAVKAVEKYMK
jgi:TRAP-type C4-dicarboxylate transport system substrate-binding protein